MASCAQRRAAFDNAELEEPLHTLIEKVAKHSGQVTDDDIRAVRASGLSEDQIFELVVCAAVGQATREYESALLTVTVGTGLTVTVPWPERLRTKRCADRLLGQLETASSWLHSSRRATSASGAPGHTRQLRNAHTTAR